MSDFKKNKKSNKNSKISNGPKREDNVTEKDKFFLGKSLFIWMFTCYASISIAKCMYGEIQGVQAVWQESSVYIQSVITLLIGYYFGTKQIE